MVTKTVKTKKLRKPRPRHINPPSVCRTVSCTDISAVRKDGVSLGHCLPHFSLQAVALWSERRGAIVTGTTRIASNGYIKEWDGKAWRYEHDLVSERVLGRTLRDNETITHVTGCSDNSINNLQLCTTVSLTVAATAQARRAAHGSAETARVSATRAQGGE